MLLFGKGTTANIYSHVDSESKKLSARAIERALGEDDGEKEKGEKRKGA